MKGARGVFAAAIRIGKLGEMRIRLLVLGAGLFALLVSTSLSAGASKSAALSTWPPFILVAGLLLVGFAANKEGVFLFVAQKVAALPGNTIVLYFGSMGLVAVVTALLNLDTSVVFLTPILVLIARARAAGEERFLYGCVFMSNAASLLLPGSNLTNLLILQHEHINGGTFLARMTGPWLVAICVTALVVMVAFRGHTSAGQEMLPLSADSVSWIGWVGPTLALIAILALAQPAIPVLVLGVLVLALTIVRGRGRWQEAMEAVDVATLVGVFGIAVALGALASAWGGPAHLLSSATRWQIAAIAAGSSVLVNNLPAAVLLGSGLPPHPRALLLGLNIGPNLAVTGSLSAILWYQAARSVGARPSVVRYTQVGIFLVPLTIAAALLITRI